MDTLLKLKSLKGFTLLELMIVVIIIGILASVAIPRYNGVIEKVKMAEALANLGMVRASMFRYWIEQFAWAGTGTYKSATLDKLDVDNPNEEINRKFVYNLEDLKEVTFRVKAARIGDVARYIAIDQDGIITGKGY